MDIFALGLKQEHLQFIGEASALDHVRRVLADPLGVWHDGEERQVAARPYSQQPPSPRRPR